MKIVSIKQNTSNWKEWRGRGIGASDAPAIMGESPWCTPFEAWLDKTGIRPRGGFNEFQIAAMRRGQELEPVARGLFEKELDGKSFESLSAEHDEHAFIRASFDGHNAELNAILEIKCPGKEDHSKAVKGKVPSKYMAQIQQQLLVSNAALCYYYSWDGKSEKGAMVKVYPDAVYQERLLAALIDFWAKVQNRIPPTVTNEDIIKLVVGMEKEIASLSSGVQVLKLITKDKTNE